MSAELAEDVATIRTNMMFAMVFDLFHPFNSQPLRVVPTPLAISLLSVFFRRNKWHESYRRRTNEAKKDHDALLPYIAIKMKSCCAINCVVVVEIFAAGRCSFYHR